VGTSVVSFIGAAIAPGAKDIYRLIAAQALIGASFAAAPLLFSVPSEILPRRWRPCEFIYRSVSDLTVAVAQAVMNVAAGIGALLGPLCIGSLTKHNIKDGWRNFYVRELERCTYAANFGSGYKCHFGVSPLCVFLLDTGRLRDIPGWTTYHSSKNYTTWIYQGSV